MASVLLHLALRLLLLLLLLAGQRGKMRERPQQEQQEREPGYFFSSRNLYTRINDVRLMRDDGERDWALKHQASSQPSGCNPFARATQNICPRLYVHCMRAGYL